MVGSSQYEQGQGSLVDDGAAYDFDVSHVLVRVGVAAPVVVLDLDEVVDESLGISPREVRLWRGFLVAALDGIRTHVDVDVCVFEFGAEEELHCEAA